MAGALRSDNTPLGGRDTEELMRSACLIITSALLLSACGADLPEPRTPFPSDKHLDVHRRWESRATTKAKNSGYWIVDFMGRGHNLVTWDFFRTISVLACLLPCLALAGQRLRNETSFSDYFLIATVVVLILTTLVYRWDSKTIWKQRVKTSLPDRDSEWDAIVLRKMQDQDAQVHQTANKPSGGDGQ